MLLFYQASSHSSIFTVAYLIAGCKLHVWRTLVDWQKSRMNFSMVARWPKNDTVAAHSRFVIDVHLKIEKNEISKCKWKWLITRGTQFAEIKSSASMTTTHHFRLHQNGSAMLLLLRNYSSHGHFIGYHSDYHIIWIIIVLGPVHRSAVICL